MIPISLNDSFKTIDAEFINPSVYPYINPGSSLVKLINLCEDFHNIVPLDKLNFQRPDPLLEHEYTYEFKAMDGRKWDQVILFTEWPDLDPLMSINTNLDKWKLSEFIHHRAIRDELVKIRSTCTLDKFKVKWL